MKTEVKQEASADKAAAKRKRLIKAEESENFVYDPIHFIRCHSKNNDPADVGTQIWEVVFEPDPNSPHKTTYNVATCGGNAICIIDCQKGVVLMKYKHKELKENFYTLAWTTLDLEGKKSNFLVSGGVRGEIRMYHPAHKVCFYEWKPTVEKKGTAVNSLVFHSERPTWLFCGTSDGYVSLWDIGMPSLPAYDGVNPVQLTRLFPDYGDVYNIAWTGASSWLLAGTAAGLVGWHIDANKVETKKMNYKPQIYDFLQPESDNDTGENPIVDSLAVLSEWTIVSKCAMHGVIYVWDLKSTLANVKPTTEKVVEQEVSLLAKLKWSNTDNFYMNLGCHKDVGMICCGDDVGTIWLYNQPQFLVKGVLPVQSVIEPTLKLAWPELQDDHVENARKVPLENNEIIIDKVATSHDSKFVVAVTSNNMVCIWKKSSDDDSSSDG